jgi:LPS sulfotransferase NodH
VSQPSFVTIVSGLPRSGTSLMMQMLSAGGIPPLTDEIRVADEDNPRGYLEFERVKQIKQDKSWLDEAAGKAVKMVHLLLYDLPQGRPYRVVFMRRNLDEVLASQRKMLTRQGKAGAQLPEEQLRKVFEDQVRKVTSWLTTQPNVKSIEVTYHELIADPRGHAARLNEFLGGGLDVDAMVGAVDPALYRNRGQP